MCGGGGVITKLDAKTYLLLYTLTTPGLFWSCLFIPLPAYCVLPRKFIGETNLMFKQGTSGEINKKLLQFSGNNVQLNPN